MTIIAIIFVAVVLTWALTHGGQPDKAGLQ